MLIVVKLSLILIGRDLSPELKARGLMYLKRKHGCLQSINRTRKLRRNYRRKQGIYFVIKFLNTTSKICFLCAYKFCN